MRSSRTQTKGERRQAKRNKRKNGMKIGSKSVFIIQQAQIKRAQRQESES